MGAIAWTVVAGIIAGLAAAAPWMAYAERIVPFLAKASARPAAYLVATSPAIVASALTIAFLLGFTTGSLRNDIVLIVAAAAVASTWGPIGRGALSVTGGPRPVGAPEPTGLRTVGAVEVSRGPRTLGFVLGIGLFMVTMTSYAIPAAASFIACHDTERLLADAEPANPNIAPMDAAFPYVPPEPLAVYVWSFPMGLELAAESRADPNAREQLVAAGYVDGYIRGWIGDDGAGIEAEIMEFETPEGATTYQGQVHRYACGYANEAFEAPMGGIGLQVRYETGAPYVEQISWVAGDRRYKIQVSAFDRPTDHSRILGLQRSLIAFWPPADPPAAAVPTPTPSPMEPAGPDATEVIRSAVEATLAEGTAWINKHWEYSGSSTTPDETTAYASGQVGLGQTRRMVVGVQYAEDPADLEGSYIGVTVDDAHIYARGVPIDRYVPEGEWLVADLASDDPRAAELRALVSGQSDPSMSLLQLYGVTRVIGESDGVVHEQHARMYTAQIDLEAALDALPPERVDGFRKNLDELAAAGFLTEFEAEIWVADDGLVHHVDYVQPLADDMGGGLITASVEFFDFGVPLSLDIPPPEHLHPVEDVKEPGRLQP
jgi:hypothetical protein